MINQLGNKKSITMMLMAMALFVPGIGLIPSKAIAETEAVTFTMTNDSGQVITHFYASPPTTSDWEDDILGVDVLAPGDSVDITINDGQEDCFYDFRAVYEDGSEVVATKQEVCDGAEYIFH
ncbi:MULTISPECIES: hypothetical protein [Planktothrix]|uniref:hypothetical protein n=1 Tax=Planktothrix TaxID=54304 RepID=UPI000420EA63|nr:MULTISPECIES: hypothetical protein [Planktothrix]